MNDFLLRLESVLKYDKVSKRAGAGGLVALVESLTNLV